MALHSTLLILKAELRQMLNGSVGKGPHRGGLMKIFKGWAGYLVLLLVAAAMGRGVYGFTTGMNAALAGYSDIARLIWVNLLASISLAGFIMLFMTGFSVVFHSMFEAGDVRFLLSTPLPAGSVVGAKLAMVTVINLLSIAPFLYPIWAGWGAASGAPVSFYFMVLVAMVLAVVLFNALVSMLVMVIMRYIGSARMRQLILLGSLVAAFLVFAGFQLFSATMSRQDGAINYANVAEIAQGLKMGSQSWSPHIWMLKASLLTMPGYGYSVWTSLVPLAAAAALAAGAAVTLARHAFLVGWGNSRESARPGGKSATSSKSGYMRTLVNRHSGAGWAIFARDLTITMRQPVLWYGVAVAIVGSVVFLHNVSGSWGADGERVRTMRAMIMMILTMMAALSTGRFSETAVSLDGEALWFMKSAPIGAVTYYRAKLAFSTLPGAIVFVVLLLGTSLLTQAPQYPLYISLPSGLAVISALSALMLMLDAIKPNFDMRLSGGDRSGRKQDPVKTLVSTFGSLIGSVLMGAVLLFPAYYSKLRWFAGWSDTAALALALAVVALLVSVTHLIAARVSVRRVRALLGRDIAIRHAGDM
jgi:hypothetical protein